MSTMGRPAPITIVLLSVHVGLLPTILLLLWSRDAVVVDIYADLTAGAPTLAMRTDHQLYGGDLLTGVLVLNKRGHLGLGF